MNSVSESIKVKLENVLTPKHLDIVNESHRHHSDLGAESHFKLVIVSEVFNGKISIKRHQMIYGILAEEIAGPVHALALHTYTPKEWRDCDQVRESPACKKSGK